MTAERIAEIERWIESSEKAGVDGIFMDHVDVRDLIADWRRLEEMFERGFQVKRTSWPYIDPWRVDGEVYDGACWTLSGTLSTGSDARTALANAIQRADKWVADNKELRERKKAA